MACASTSEAVPASAVQREGCASEAQEHGEAAGPPLSLKQVIRIVHKTLRDKEASHEAQSEALLDALRRYDATKGDWKRYAHFDEHKHYTRNLISTDREMFTLMLLCWNPTRESPIHDHPCDGCWMRCIQGAVAETRYTMPSSPADGPSPPLTELSCTTLTAPEVAYIDDQQGLHKVGSVGSGPAITLHLYAPPFAECRVWLNPACPDRVLRPVVTFHSEHGTVVQYDSAAQRSKGCAGCAPSICDVEGGEESQGEAPLAPPATGGE